MSKRKAPETPAGGIETPAKMRRPGLRLNVVCDRPRIVTCHGFMTSEECDRMIKMCLPLTMQLPGCHKLRCEPGLLKHVEKLSQEDKRLVADLERRIGDVVDTPPHDQETGMNVNGTPPDGSRIDEDGNVVILKPEEMQPAFEFPGASDMMQLGLHVDTHNGKPMRFVTAIVYLTTLTHEAGGQTVFPCAERKGTPTKESVHHVASTSSSTWSSTSSHVPEKKMKSAHSNRSPREERGVERKEECAEGEKSLRAGRWLLDRDIQHTASAFGHSEDESDSAQEAARFVESQAMTLVGHSDRLVHCRHAVANPEVKLRQPPGIGVCVRPEKGMLCLFYSVDPDALSPPQTSGHPNANTNANGEESRESKESWRADPRAWHGGARVCYGNPVAKWTLQKFKEIPPDSRGSFEQRYAYVSARYGKESWPKAR